MQSIQLIQMSPEELTHLILSSVNSTLTKFFDELNQLGISINQKEIMTLKELLNQLVSQIEGSVTTRTPQGIHLP